MRVGFGYDVHPLVAGRPLVLAGVLVPFDRGLDGYSDGDVVAHALIDALLGAAALGDCGAHFPAGDPRFKGADSVDLVITNYALHHLLDADKEHVVEAAFDWLRPGGQLVVADMMLGRGTTHRDREIIAGKVRIMAKKGIPGYWRILKNAGRYLFRVQERPITPEAWSRLFEKAGFGEVRSDIVVAEAAVVTGVKAAS